MKKVIIMSGVSGSGKSTMARKMQMKFLDNPNPNECTLIVSADRYFMRDNEYRFNPAELGKAHAECFRSFINCVQVGMDLVIVDNTNTTVEEISPYILGAEAFGYEAEVVTVITSNMTDLERCAARNTHSVPMQGVSAQYHRICNRSLPPWWNARTMLAKF